jgi:hypothetical protein
MRSPQHEARYTRLRFEAGPEPEGPPWWLGTILAIIATGVCLAPVWVPIVWEMVR